MANLEQGHKGHDRDTEIARGVIDSPEYGRRLSKLGEASKVQQKIIDESRKALYHRSGTRYEDLVFIDSVTGKVSRVTDYEVEHQVLPTKSMRRMANKADDYTIVAIHNHPQSTIPSRADIESMVAHKYKYGLVVGHDGTIFKYSIMGEFIPSWYIAAIRRLEQSGYSEEGMAVFIAESKETGILVEVL